jgi:hypothetical protein
MKIEINKILEELIELKGLLDAAEILNFNLQKDIEFFKDKPRSQIKVSYLENNYVNELLDSLQFDLEMTDFALPVALCYAKAICLGSVLLDIKSEWLE